MKYAIVTEDMFLSTYDGKDLGIKIAWSSNQTQAELTCNKSSEFFGFATNLADADELSSETNFSLSEKEGFELLMGFCPKVIKPLKSGIQ